MPQLLSNNIYRTLHIPYQRTTKNQQGTNRLSFIFEMLGSSLLKKILLCILFSFVLLYSMGKNEWEVTHAGLLMKNYSSYYRHVYENNCLQGQLPFKITVLHLHGHIKFAVKSVLRECQFFSIWRGKAGSSMSRQMCSGVLSLDSKGYTAFKEDKDWLCYKRTSHFLERKMHWFFRKIQTYCELQGTAIWRGRKRLRCD